MNRMFFWLAFGFFWVLLELGHPSLFFYLSCALGSGAAATVAWYNYPVILQASAFLAGTLIAFIPLQIWVRGKQSHTAHTSTNAYALIGKEGVVVKAIQPDQSGRVKVNGQTWVARSGSKEEIVVGSRVKVTQILGIHLIVRVLDPKEITHGT